MLQADLYNKLSQSKVINEAALRSGYRQGRYQRGLGRYRRGDQGVGNGRSLGGRAGTGNDAIRTGPNFFYQLNAVTYVRYLSPGRSPLAGFLRI